MGDRFDGGSLAFRRDRGSRFDNVHAEFVEGLSNPQFLLGRERHTRGLLSIAQRRVEKLDVVK
jgi:hypothetical protein